MALKMITTLAQGQFLGFEDADAGAPAVTKPSGSTVWNAIDKGYYTSDGTSWTFLGPGGASNMNGLAGSGALGAVTVSVNDAAYVGVHDYTTFELAAGVTLSPGASNRPVIIRATQSITIRGNIDVSGNCTIASGAYAFGSVGGTGSGGGGGGGNGTSGNGLDGAAGAAGAGSTANGYAGATGGSAGAAGVHGAPGGAGGNGTQGAPGVVLDEYVDLLDEWPAGPSRNVYGGYVGADGNPGGVGGRGSGAAAGGNGGANGTGGNGGGCVVLISPSITIANTSTIDASGADGTAAVAGAPGSAAPGGSNEGGGGGGGGGSGGGGGCGGQVLMVTVLNGLTNAGTQTVAGGAGGAGAAGGAGGANDGTGSIGGAGGIGRAGSDGSLGLLLELEIAPA